MKIMILKSKNINWQNSSVIHPFCLKVQNAQHFICKCSMQKGVLSYINCGMQSGSQAVTPLK